MYKIYKREGRDSSFDQSSFLSAFDFVVLLSISFVRIQSKIWSVTCSTGWSKRYGKTGTIARPVTVGPQVLTLGFVTLRKTFRDWATAVWIVNAGRALYNRLQLKFLVIDDRMDLHGGYRLKGSTLNSSYANSGGLRKIGSFSRWRATKVSFIGIVCDVSTKLR